jgi:hypothetical protein
VLWGGGVLSSVSVLFLIPLEEPLMGSRWFALDVCLGRVIAEEVGSLAGLLSVFWMGRGDIRDIGSLFISWLIRLAGWGDVRY